MADQAQATRSPESAQDEVVVSSNGRPESPSVESYQLDDENEVLVRRVRTRDGEMIESVLGVDDVEVAAETEDWAALYDQAWLRSDVCPGRQPNDRGTVRLVDLFSGCGGMTLGVWEACRALRLQMKPLLAVDVDQAARSVFESNFSEAEVEDDRVEELLDGELGEALTESESALRERVGQVNVLVAGPPCQGSSDLNNHTRREDPKNALYAKVGRAAEVLEPDHIIVENVLGIRHDKDRVFQRTKKFLESEIDLEENGYSVDAGTLRSEEIGVAQNRHRVFMVASRRHGVDLDEIIGRFRTGTRDFRWACADLLDAAEGQSGFDSTTSPAPVTEKRIDHLFENDLHDLPDTLRPPCHRDKDHNYPSVYGRMWEDRPAPTITTGFTSMGQGRFVHPRRKRTITPHEAARLQFFPDFYGFGDRSRAAYKTLIGNAVPPKLTYVLALELLR